MCKMQALTSLLLLVLITVARAQYFDILQGLQQLFQPYPQNDYLSQYNGVTRNPVSHRQDSRKKNQGQIAEERRTKKPPENQYDYLFATTQKPKRKQSKTNSSHSSNSRNISNKNQYSNLLLGDYYTPPFEAITHSNRAKVKITTQAYSNFFDNRVTTQNVGSNFNNFGLNNDRVTENVFENHGVSFATNNYPNKRPDNFNNRNGNNDTPKRTQNNDRNNIWGVTDTTNSYRGILNTDYDNPQRPYNTDTVFNNNQQIRPSNNQNRPSNNLRPSNVGFGTPGVIAGVNNFDIGPPISRITPTQSRPLFGNPGISQPSNFNNRGNSNREGSLYFPDNDPLVDRPGVRPAPVAPGQPAITNKPVDDRNTGVNRPTDQSSITFAKEPNTEPDILIGPDEDEMTERQKRRYVELAEKMCDRYKALNVRKVFALPLLPSTDPVEVDISSCTPITVPLVIGGKVVSIKDFPHMALLGWMKIRNAGYSWKCGGSLISDRYVLTAAHCTFQDRDYDVVSGPPQAVQLGSSFLDDPGALVVRISEVIRHPKYKMRRSYHDIALVKLVSKVTFSEVIRPACLGSPPPEGEKMIATGWGRTENGGDHSEELRSVSLPVWNMQECREVWGTSLKLPDGPTPDSHVCAGVKSGGKDTCQGDSGGPGVVPDGCAWRVVAVTSFGRSCGAPGTPALYARIPIPFVAAQAFGPGN